MPLLKPDTVRLSVETAKKIADVLGFPWTRFFENVEETDNKEPPAGPGV